MLSAERESHPSRARNCGTVPHLRNASPKALTSSVRNVRYSCLTRLSLIFERSGNRASLLRFHVILLPHRTPEPANRSGAPGTLGSRSRPSSATSRASASTRRSASSSGPAMSHSCVTGCCRVASPASRPSRFGTSSFKATGARSTSSSATSFPVAAALAPGAEAAWRRAWRSRHPRAHLRARLCQDASRLAKQFSRGVAGLLSGNINVRQMIFAKQQ